MVAAILAPANVTVCFSVCITTKKSLQAFKMFQQPGKEDLIYETQIILEKIQ